MNRHYFFSCLLLILCQGCISTQHGLRPGDRFTPVPIVYKPVSDEENLKAQDALTAILINMNSADSLHQLLPSSSICGPFLWAKLCHNPELATNKLCTVEMRAPITDNGVIKDIQILKGKLFQNTLEVQLLWDAIALDIAPTTSDTIRKLDDNEKDIFWTLIPFDSIEEPIFIIEGIDYKILVMMIEKDGQYTPFWVDDLNGVTFRS